MTSYHSNNSYYPPPQNVTQGRERASSRSPPRQPRSASPVAYAPAQPYQNIPYDPYAQQASSNETHQSELFHTDTQDYDQRPRASSERQLVYQQSSFLAPPSAPMAPARPSSRDGLEQYDSSLRTPRYERRPSTSSTHSRRSNHSTHSHRSSRSAGGRSTQSYHSNSSNHYVTKDGEVIDVDSLDKKPSYGDSVFLVWNGLKKIWSRREA